MYSKVSQLHISMDPLFFRFFSHMGHYGSIEYSSLCYTLSSYWLSILYVVVCICESQSPNLSLSPCRSSLVIISLFSTSVTLISENLPSCLCSNVIFLNEAYLHTLFKIATSLSSTYSVLLALF